MAASTKYTIKIVGINKIDGKDYYMCHFINLNTPDYGLEDHELFAISVANIDSSLGRVEILITDYVLRRFLGQRPDLFRKFRLRFTGGSTDAPLYLSPERFYHHLKGIPDDNWSKFNPAMFEAISSMKLILAIEAFNAEREAEMKQLEDQVVDVTERIAKLADLFNKILMRPDAKSLTVPKIDVMRSHFSAIEGLQRSLVHHSTN